MRTLALCLILAASGPAWAQAPTGAPGTAPAVTETSAAVAAFLRENPVGAVFSLGDMDPLTLPDLPLIRRHDAGRLVYSGSPEYCPGPGILYEDTFDSAAPIRLYVYHTNASDRPLRFTVALVNEGPPARVAVDDRLVIGPSLNYFFVGRLGAFMQLGRPRPPEPRIINVDGLTLLDKDLDARVVPPGKPEPLIHSLHDFRVLEGRVKVIVAAVEVDRSTARQIPALPLLGRDTHHDRGTFDFTEASLSLQRTYRTTDGIRQMRLADGKVDPFAQGVDVTTGRIERYRGNYGVIYRVRLRLESPDGRKVAVVLNPRGGGLGGAVAAWAPKRGRTAAYTPLLSRGPVREKSDAVILGRFDPRETPEVHIVWTPPGSASLPVQWLLIPY